MRQRVRPCDVRYGLHVDGTGGDTRGEGAGGRRIGTTPLSNPALAALSGPQAHLAERRGSAMRYPSSMSPIAALPTDPSPPDWANARDLVGPGGSLFLPVVEVDAPSGWTTTMSLPGVQMVDDGLDAMPDDEAVILTSDDVPEMLDLVRRTKPGPFAQRTVELGTYLGIRRDGRLVAMGGERMRPPGWTEISAVCTDPAYRGHGLAARIVRALGHGIRARGDTPFLHADGTNVNAIRLYESLGFVLAAQVMFTVLLAPE